VNQDHVQEANQEDLGFVIRNGIVVVIKNATILDGMPQVSAVPYIISGCV
jgi:glucose-1-phosphate adenylyltransferase